MILILVSVYYKHQSRGKQMTKKQVEKMLKHMKKQLNVNNKKMGQFRKDVAIKRKFVAGRSAA